MSNMLQSDCTIARTSSAAPARTWQAASYPSDPTICDVTDRSYQSVQLIMKHYRAGNAADATIDKLVAFISIGGLA